MGALELIFQVFSPPDDPVLPTADFLTLASFLLTRFETVSPAFMQEFEKAIVTAHDGEYKDAISFQQLAELEIADSLR